MLEVSKNLKNFFFIPVNMLKIKKLQLLDLDFPEKDIWELKISMTEALWVGGQDIQLFFDFF